MTSRTSPVPSSHSPLADSGTSLAPAPKGTLGRLTAHFVAAKRALASTSHVYRANEIVSDARQHLESLATHDAQTTYLRQAISNQLNILKGIHHGLCVAADEGSADFQAILKRLDDADAQIQRTLQVLKQTDIEPTFRPEEEAPRSLHSFLDERGLGELKAQFRECIDLTTEAHGNFCDGNAEFAKEIEGIERALEGDDDDEGEGRRTGLIGGEVHDSDERHGPAELFRGLEEHASEMAELLQSLVKHYDLCITALKHTEGGGEAVHAAYRQSNRDTGEVDETFEQGIPSEPMSNEERDEMLAVLDDDAREVDDAANEMRERAAEMETQLSRLQVHASRSTTSHLKATRIVVSLERLSSSGRLTKYVSASKIYAERWSEIRARIESGLEEFGQLAVFFKGFQTAYQYLLLEIDRRGTTRAAMDQVMDKTRRTIDGLYEEEEDRRNQFRAEYGDFLPADMWPPLVDPPTKWVIERKDDGTADIPSVRQDSLRRAKELLQPRRRSKEQR